MAGDVSVSGRFVHALDEQGCRHVHRQNDENENGGRGEGPVEGDAFRDQKIEVDRKDARRREKVGRHPVVGAHCKNQGRGLPDRPPDAQDDSGQDAG